MDRNMKFTLKDYLSESDKFQEVVNSYLIATNDPIDKRIKKHKKQFQKVLDPNKWREYLQYANISN